MNSFWQDVIEPVLETLKPSIVVEIGADRGKNTLSLLDFCARQKSILHSIDPDPRFDISVSIKLCVESFIFHRSLSLEAIPRLGPMDAVLIDGDHNWYTVYHELKQIETITEREKQPFPLVFLHDTAWPYAHRDMYYQPLTVPTSYRKPNRYAGMVLGLSGLQDEGFNSHLLNAEHEGGSRNGVLTAIEDFLKQTRQELEFINIPCFHGLGVLYPADLSSQGALGTFLGRLRVALDHSPELVRLERRRVALELIAPKHSSSVSRERGCRAAPSICFPTHCGHGDEANTQNPESEGSEELCSPRNHMPLCSLRKRLLQEISELLAAIHESRLKK